MIEKLQTERPQTQTREQWPQASQVHKEAIEEPQVQEETIEEPINL